MRVSREIEPLISEEGRAMVLITRTAHLIDLEKKKGKQLKINWEICTQHTTCMCSYGHGACDP